MPFLSSGKIVGSADIFLAFCLDSTSALTLKRGNAIAWLYGTRFMVVPPQLRGKRSCGDICCYWTLYEKIKGRPPVTSFQNADERQPRPRLGPFPEVAC